MKVSFTHRFQRQYQALAEKHKGKFDKQLEFLLLNLRHPSLRAKKYDESNEVWQARVDKDYRFYFKIEADTYILLSIIPHQK